MGKLFGTDGIRGIVGENLALEIVNVFLNTPFSGEARHQRRIDLIEKADK